MNYIWSPWRMEYMEHSKVEGCIFCMAQEMEDSTENLIAIEASMPT